jgi:hypothetical protein
MADQSSYPEPNSGAGRDAGAGPERGSPPKTPRWVKLFGIIALVLILVVVIGLVAGVAGPHGPRRHIPARDTRNTLLASAAEGFTLSGGIPDGLLVTTERGANQP